MKTESIVESIVTIVLLGLLLFSQSSIYYNLSHPPPPPPGIMLSRLDLPPAFVVQVVVSGIVLFSSLTVILLKRYSPKDKHWAYASVGTILGFWLHFSK